MYKYCSNLQTANEFTKSNLKKTNDGHIVSRKASNASKKSMSSYFKAFVTLAKASKGKKFAKIPKKGTQKYNNVIKSCK